MAERGRCAAGTGPAEPRQSGTAPSGRGGALQHFPSAGRWDGRGAPAVEPRARASARVRANGREGLKLITSSRKLL